MRNLRTAWTTAVVALACCAGGCEQPRTPTRQAARTKPIPSTYKVQRQATDDNLAYDVIATMWEHSDFYDDEQTYLRSVAPATPGQRAIYACTWYIAEVNNGGHHQFFSNPTGMVWEDALRGFDLLGAQKHRAILQDAVNLFPNSTPSKDRDQREAQLEAIDAAKLDPLDDRLYESGEDFDALAAEYVRAHPDDFFLE